MRRIRGRKTTHVGAGLVGALLFAFALVGAASANHNPNYSGTADTHFVVGGNPGCPKGTSLVKVDPAAEGTFGNGAVEIYDLEDGTTFSWRFTSSGVHDFDMAAVVVKGGPVEDPEGQKAASVVYTYDSGNGGADDSDSGLTAPIGEDGKLYGISHIEFCVDPKDGGSSESDLLVSKTAQTEWEQVKEWSVVKTVNPPSLNLTYPNGTGKVTWTIEVDQTGSSARDAKVFGTITVSNPNESEVTGVSVADSLSGAVVDCSESGGNQNTELTIPGKGSITCTYTANVPSATSGTNIATATATLGEEDISGSGSAGYSFGEPKSVINGSVSAEDSDENSWEEITQDSTFTYEETFRCGNAGRTNTVVLHGDNPATEEVETDYVLDDSSAAVVVTCSPTPPVTPPTVTPPSTPNIDIQVVKDATAQVTLGSNGKAEIAYSAVVKNNGPNQANNVTLVDAAPDGVEFDKITKQPDFGSCSINPSLLNCNLGSMGAGVQTTITWTAIVNQASISVSPIVNWAQAGGTGAIDTNPANNRDDARTIVLAPVTPPTPKPKPEPTPKPQPKPVAICLKLTVNGTRAVTAGKGSVAFKVTRAGKPAAGVGVVVKGAGIYRVAKTNAAGLVTLKTVSGKSGIVTATITPAKKGCNSARVGVIGIFEPPVTG